MHSGSQRGGPVSGRRQSTASYHRARPEVASPRQSFERRFSACRLVANALADRQSMHALYGRPGAPD